MGIFKDYLTKTRQISQDAKEREKEQYRNSPSRAARQMQEEFDQQDAADEFAKKAALAVGKGIFKGGAKLTKAAFRKMNAKK
ncbi:hypothetical protein [Liquorilactobacillus satsumensis]|uniref:Uncharacterized protein n=1 Tax=Liquorilactobacillus satsumensis DSM 16230 = JCM 12392 TaxID=1423801 RepID=A0A0R1UY31_9LACO|nr:hypothetical protein [Liquorilactobacillus satsumensis]KRL98054.1 hypothetical protein FD50_GL001013 [Liquorilactobacillus satsumensis DSM 16230 = JCM 12392]MCC7665859.1 hypothetical protein [Liquorilactobacillus satsumensis]MCP9356567.1 hypothetical protein [Liquorilactobacillus satsumensis]MCP9370507.1 hypothetical protein [Liquorilactobacillus satsumensis]